MRRREETFNLLTWLAVFLFTWEPDLSEHLHIASGGHRRNLTFSIFRITPSQLHLPI